MTDSLGLATKLMYEEESPSLPLCNLDDVTGNPSASVFQFHRETHSFWVSHLQ